MKCKLLETLWFEGDWRGIETGKKRRKRKREGRRGVEIEGERAREDRQRRKKIDGKIERRRWREN